MSTYSSRLLWALVCDYGAGDAGDFELWPSSLTTWKSSRPLKVNAVFGFYHSYDWCLVCCNILPSTSGTVFREAIGLRG